MRLLVLTGHARHSGSKSLTIPRTRQFFLFFWAGWCALRIPSIFLSFSLAEKENKKKKIYDIEQHLKEGPINNFSFYTLFTGQILNLAGIIIFYLFK